MININNVSGLMLGNPDICMYMYRGQSTDKPASNNNVMRKKFSGNTFFSVLNAQAKKIEVATTRIIAILIDNPLGRMAAVVPNKVAAKKNVSISPQLILEIYIIIFFIVAMS